jgi:predicted nucleic acid-binding protein
MTFVDTSAFYALTDKSDANHRRARSMLARLSRRREELLTSGDVLDETVTLVRYRLGHPAAVKLGTSLMQSSWCRLVDVTRETRLAAWDIFLRYSDQSFSLTDCTSFALMRSMSISDAFTFDHRDFAAAGFVVST